MNRAQTIADSFRAMGVELAPERSEEVVGLMYELAHLAGGPIRVAFNGALIAVAGSRLTFIKLEH